jgi:hypothetical protein
MPIRTIMLLMPVVMFGLFLISVVVGIFRNKSRNQQMQAEAQSLGLTFTSWGEPRSASKIATPFFLKGSAGFKNVMTGSYAGMNVEVFDYSHTSGSAQNTSVTVQTVALYTHNVDFPTFALGPGGLAAKLLDALDHQNVEVTTDKEFLHHHSVRGNDKERIKALFSQPVIDFVKQLERSKPWQIEGAGNQLVIYRYARRIKPAMLKDFLQETSAIAQSFFAYAGASKPGSFSASSNR